MHFIKIISPKILIASVAIVVALLTAGSASAQAKKNAETMPAFGLRLIQDSFVNTRNIPKGMPTAFVLFSPDCNHCADLAREITDSALARENFRLVMVSPPMPFAEIRKFAQINGLAHRNNIWVAQDTGFFFGAHFHASTVPFVVVFDKNKKQQAILQRMKHFGELLDVVHTLKK